MKKNTDLYVPYVPMWLKKFYVVYVPMWSIKILCAQCAYVVQNKILCGLKTK
jgi:hypothetical protein